MVGGVPFEGAFGQLILAFLNCQPLFAQRPKLREKVWPGGLLSWQTRKLLWELGNSELQPSLAVI